jgi:parallel beta-helix repeat protein/putative cofactor-binding repeat protein
VKSSSNGGVRIATMFLLRRRGMMKRVLLFSLLAGLLGASVAVAAPGSIPISQPIIITDPGHYVVTRDFEVAAGVAIDIQSDHVDVDLNGHTITSTSLVDAVISVDDVNFVRIGNGMVIGGLYGVESASTAGITLMIERVAVSGTGSDGMHLAGILHAAVNSCVITQAGNSGLYVAPPPAGEPVSGHLVDNSIIEASNRGIYLAFARDVVIEGNVIAGANGGCISFGGVGGGNIIKRNSCSLKVDGVIPAIGIQLDSDNNQVLNNTVKGFSHAGIMVLSDGNRIAENVVADTVVIGSVTGAGILVSGGLGPDVVRNLIEGNQIEDNAGCGILLETSAAASVYRNNMLRGNGGGAVCDSGTGNTDAGGNIP